MLDDCRSRLEDRVRFITEIWAGTFQDYRTRHFVQRLQHEVTQANVCRVRTNFQLICTPHGSNQKTVVIPGIYEDLVDLGPENATFLSKKAITDEAVLPRYLVYPI